MSKRGMAIINARIAGYHNDSLSFTRLRVESRVSSQAMNDAWSEGARMKRNGIPCNCYQCTKNQVQP